jgi:hypothetical protein
MLMVVGLYAFSVSDERQKNVSVEEFREFIQPKGLQFTLPEGFKATAVKENRNLWYAFAMKNEQVDFEVRYSIWSLQSDLENYEECQQTPECFMLHPNQMFQGRVQSNVLNMTAGERMDVEAFPSAAVRKEFNADAGGSSFFEFNCEFGKGYKYGQMVYLHKDDVADVIITFLSNNQETHSDLMLKAFYALIFK